jgi:UDP-glucuronate 4-epimerase
MNKILVTGAAGFIGASLVKALLKRENNVVGIDNHNNYYDIKLKENRITESIANKNYIHIRSDIADKAEINKIFEDFRPNIVVNLAAQAGVRYSIENPKAYIDSNVVGFSNILECSREFKIKHLVYASSSSVYGANEAMPFSIHDNVDHPLSLYAATKKSNELIAHAYSNLFQLPTTGLRFFTVYGPWGRPDMALFKFTKAILEEMPIEIYNYGDHLRDFTYIDDIVEGILRIMERPAYPNSNWDGKKPDPGSSFAPWRIYNIGNNNPVKLSDFIISIEKALGKTANKKLLPLQPGDVPSTYANIDDLVQHFNYEPKTSIDFGVNCFVEWYKNYYKV